MPKSEVLRGFVELIEKRYQLKVVASDYVKIDDKYARYNMMLEMQMEPKLLKAFQAKYQGKDSANHVAWSYFEDKIRFNAEIGNNILLLLDEVTVE